MLVYLISITLTGECQARHGTDAWMDEPQAAERSAAICHCGARAARYLALAEEEYPARELNHSCCESSRTVMLCS